MKSTSFKETNRVFTPGGNPNTDQLAVCIAEVHYEGEPSPTRFIVSKWKLDEEDLKRINETRELWISIMGMGMPPIMPTLYNPFTEHGMKPVE